MTLSEDHRAFLRSQAIAEVLWIAPRVLPSFTGDQLPGVEPLPQQCQPHIAFNQFRDGD